MLYIQCWAVELSQLVAGYKVYRPESISRIYTHHSCGHIYRYLCLGHETVAQITLAVAAGIFICPHDVFVQWVHRL